MIAGTLGNFYGQLGGGRWAIGYDAGESLRIRRDLGYNRATPRSEEGFVAYDGTREMIRLKCSDLRRNMPVIAGACDRIGLFGAPLRPQWRTDDPAWNREAEQFITDWGKTCDTRGRLTLDALQRMALSLRPTHGGIYIETLADGSIRPVECERIRQPKDPTEAKAYTDGVRVDRATGRILGYKIHVRDDKGGFSGKHAESFVPADSIIPVIRPPWRIDQVREIGDLAPAVPAMQDLHEANKFTLGTLKSQSEYIGFLTRAGGVGANSGPRGSTPEVGARQTVKQEWGQLLEGKPGDSLTMAASPTPGATHIPYMKWQLTLAATVLQFPYEFFALDLAQLDWSRMRGTLILVNKVFSSDYWPWLVDRMLNPLVNWRVAMAMRPGGELGPAPVDATGRSQWDRLEWFPPEEVWLDRQETAQADMLEMQMGKSTLGEVLKRKGVDLQDHVTTRAREIKLIEKIAQDEGVHPDQLHKLQIPGQTDAAKKDSKQDANDDANDDANNRTNRTNGNRPTALARADSAVL